MPTGAINLTERLNQIRSAFDDAFALPLEADTEEHLQVLIFGIAGRRFGFRMAGLSAIQKLPAITPLPGQKPPLMGIVAVSGELIGVFDLAALLGSEERGPSRGWIALLDHGKGRIALFFEMLIGTRRVKAGDFIDVGSSCATELASSAIQDEVGVIPVIDLNMVRALVNKKTEL